MFKRIYSTLFLVGFCLVSFICPASVAAEPALWEIFNTLYSTGLTSNTELWDNYGYVCSDTGDPCTVATEATDCPGGTCNHPIDDNVFEETNGYVMAGVRYAGYTQSFGYYTVLCTGSDPIDLFNVTKTGYLFECSAESQNSGASCIEDGDCPDGTCDPLYDSFFLVGGGTAVIGLYCDPSGSPQWYSQPSLNVDGNNDHLWTFRTHDYTPLSPEYLLAWEDLNLGDADYNDLVVVTGHLESHVIECCEVNSDCDDGVSCTDDSCVDSVCQYTPNDANCDDGVGCTDNTCDPALDCQFTPNDANCDDGVGCTEDTCDSVLDCQFTPNDSNCDDGVGCTDDTCDLTLDCQFTPNDANCDDGVGCTDDTCDSISDCQFRPDDAFCDDGEFCNGAETCDSLAGCQPGTDPCTLPYLCDEDGDQCVMADVIMTPEPAWAAPGDVGVKVDLCLDNQGYEVGGIQVDICEEIDGIPIDCLTCVGCEMTERTVLFDCFVYELDDGCCRVILLSKHPGGVINPAICSVVKIDYTFCDPDDPECPEECNSVDCITLTPENMLIADPYGNPLAAAGMEGEVCPFECGDVYPPESAPGEKDCGNGDVDLVDIITEVDFALGGITPDDCQWLRADVPTGTPGYGSPPYCTPPDGSVNVLDIMVIIDMVLDRQDCCTYYYTGGIY